MSSAFQTQGTESPAVTSPEAFTRACETAIYVSPFIPESTKLSVREGGLGRGSCGSVGFNKRPWGPGSGGGVHSEQPSSPGAEAETGFQTGLFTSC